MKDAVPMWSPCPGRFGPIFAVPTMTPSISATTVLPGGCSIQRSRAASDVRAIG